MISTRETFCETIVEMKNFSRDELERRTYLLNDNRALGDWGQVGGGGKKSDPH